MKVRAIVVALTVVWGIGCASRTDAPSAQDGGAVSRGPSSDARAQPEPPGGELPEPAPCSTDVECKESCPPDVERCACLPTPSLGNRCIPTCETDADCKFEGAPALVCQQNACVPPSM